MQMHGRIFHFSADSFYTSTHGIYIVKHDIQVKYVRQKRPTAVHSYKAECRVHKCTFQSCDCPG